MAAWWLSTTAYGKLSSWVSRNPKLGSAMREWLSWSPGAGMVGISMSSWGPHHNPDQPCPPRSSGPRLLSQWASAHLWSLGLSSQPLMRQTGVSGGPKEGLRWCASATLPASLSLGEEWLCSTETEYRGHPKQASSWPNYHRCLSGSSQDQSRPELTSRFRSGCNHLLVLDTLLHSGSWAGSGYFVTQWELTNTDCQHLPSQEGRPEKHSTGCSGGFKGWGFGVRRFQRACLNWASRGGGKDISGRGMSTSRSAGEHGLRDQKWRVKRLGRQEQDPEGLGWLVQRAPVWAAQGQSCGV